MKIPDFITDFISKDLDHMSKIILQGRKKPNYLRDFSYQQQCTLKYVMRKIVGKNFKNESRGWT